MTILPSSYDDCISRREALNVVHKYFEHYLQLNDDICLDGLRSLPSVTPKEKIGHWVNVKVGKLFPSNDFKCSECGNILDFDGVNCGRGDANYCPNCGCHMIEPQESEENNDNTTEQL